MPGRITVFTRQDINSHSVTKALRLRNLPFHEISLDKYPERVQDLVALSGKSSLPRVFFNTRHVGGLEETLKELVSKWDNSMYGTALDKYNAEMEMLHEPQSPQLALPSAYSTPYVASEDRNLQVSSKIRLIDETATTFHDITEKLKNTLQMADIKFRGVMYKQAFSGSHAVKAFETSLRVSKKDSIFFANLLLSQDVIKRVSPGCAGSLGRFQDSDKAIYKLRCFVQPRVLNTYMTWKGKALADPVKMLKNLDLLLRSIEMDSVAFNGLLNHAKMMKHSSFPIFEELTSQLQVINFLSLPTKEKLPFALNLYTLLLRYSFIKFGVPVTDADRLHMLSTLEFNIGGHIFSLNEWINGVLRGNPRTNGKRTFKRTDPRRTFALKTVDSRIHYALHTGEHLGSRRSLPFPSYSSRNIDKQLDIAGHVFWEDERNFEVNPEKLEIRIPKVLVWHRWDFGDSLTSAVEKFADHMQISQIHQLRELLHHDKTKIVFQESNWAGNADSFARYSKDSVSSDENLIQATMRRFKTPSIPDNEKVRLATLNRLNVLDTLPEERFDRITRMVRMDFAVPMVFLNFVDETRGWVKSCQCLVKVPPQVDREVSLCGHVILQDDPLIVDDLLLDDRFADNPVVKAAGARFYVGCPISVPACNGTGIANVGSLCLIDTKPRHVTKSEKRLLKEYTRKIEKELVLSSSGEFTTSAYKSAEMMDEATKVPLKQQKYKNPNKFPLL